MTANFRASDASGYNAVRIATLLWASALVEMLGGTAHGQGGEIQQVSIEDVVAASCSYSSSRARPQWIANEDRLIIQAPGCSRTSDAIDGPLIVVDLSDGNFRQIARGRFPLVSRNGEWIAYLSGGSSNSVLKIRSLPTGEERVVRRFGGSPSLGYNFAMAWSPHDDRLAYAFQKTDDSAPKLAQTNTAVVSAKDNLPSGSQLRTFSVHEGANTSVASFAGRISSISWARSGSELFVSSYTLGHVMGDGGARSQLDIVDLANKAIVTAYAKSGAVSWKMSPVISPDGRLIAVDQYPKGGWPADNQVEILRTDGRAVTSIAGEKPVWTADSNSLYVVRRDGAYDAIYRVSLNSQIDRISRKSASARNIAISGDGKKIAWVEIDALGAHRVLAASSSGETPKIVFSASPSAARFHAAEVTELCWTSRDQADLCGLIISPKTKTGSTGPRPLIVDVHGGPVGGLSLFGSMVVCTPLEWQLWTKRGYVVFIPEYRMSGLAGMDPILATRRRGTILEDNVYDIMVGVDRLVADGVADPDRMAILGHSYGATIVNYLVTQTGRFRAAVSKEGLSDHYHGSTFSDDLTEWLFKTTPWKNRQRYLENSATYLVENIETPMLFMRGSDSGIPAYHNQFLFRALRSKSIDTEMITYNGEGHHFDNMKNRRDVIERTLKWVDERIE